MVTKSKTIGGGGPRDSLSATACTVARRAARDEGVVFTLRGLAVSMDQKAAWADLNALALGTFPFHDLRTPSIRASWRPE